MFSRRTVLVLFMFVLAFPAARAHAFQIKPESEVDGVVRSLTPQSWWGILVNNGYFLAVDRFSHGEHERAMQLAWGCPQDAQCDRTTPGYPFAPAAFLAGVRWNDNPPFELTNTSMKECMGKTMALPNFGECWFKVFLDGEKRAKKGQTLDLNAGYVTMLRSHFGDLQFLHAMASDKAETAGETRDKILMWAEFTWRTALGEFGCGTMLTDTGIPGLRKYFRPGESVQTLFTRGNPTHRSRIGEVALGSLFHVVHDSFTKSHVDRDESNGTPCGPGLPLRPGRIRQFLNYAMQDSAKHAQEDKRNAVTLQLATVSPNMIDASKYLIEKYAQKASWDEVQPYLACLFEVEDETVVTGPGRF